MWPDGGAGQMIRWRIKFIDDIELMGSLNNDTVLRTNNDPRMAWADYIIVNNHLSYMVIPAYLLKDPRLFGLVQGWSRKNPQIWDYYQEISAFRPML